MSMKDFEGIQELAKQNHAKRVAKNPERIMYAIKQLESNNIEYALKNTENGHFHAWDLHGDLHQFWASTGKIFGSDQRGIHNFINRLKRGEK